MRLHKDGGVAVNVVMKSECCPLDRKRSLLVRLHKEGGIAVNVVMKSECCPLRLEEKSTGTPPQRW